jgi:ribosomal protein S17E
MKVGTVTDANVKAITRNLRESYGPDITEDLIRSEIANLREGQEPTTIIGKFTKGMLEQAGIITDEEDSDGG